MVATPTLKAAVRGGHEFLQVQPCMSGSGIRMVQPDEAHKKPDQLAVTQVKPDSMRLLKETLQALTAEVTTLKQQISTTQRTAIVPDNGDTFTRCWNCNQLEEKLSLKEKPDPGNCLPAAEVGSPAGCKWARGSKTT